MTVRATLIPRAVVEGRRIGLFGGSFNPPHEGHRAVAEWALKRLQLDELWWLVATRNPLKTTAGAADLKDRLAATRRLARHPRMRALDLERKAGAIYTADLLDALAPALGSGLFVWVMGADAFAGLHHWRRWRDIMHTLPIAVFDRPGWRLKALASPAAHAFRHFRLQQHEAALLPELAAPAWTFLSMPLHDVSSTCLRQPEGCR